MPNKHYRTGYIRNAAASWRSFTPNLSLALFASLSVFLLILNQARPVAVENFRTTVMDRLAPIMNALSRPAEVIADVGQNISHYLNVKNNNERLEAENAALVVWQNKALLLAKENSELKRMLHYQAPPTATYISARVVADTGGAFVQTIIVTAGASDGVRTGMAAIVDGVLVGRVIEVGDHSSRIMPLTDINSRIPITVTSGGENAILAGDGAIGLDLMFLPRDAEPPIGSRVMTSGHGGIFPPDLPIGTITKTEDGNGYKVIPPRMISQINHVQLVDFGINERVTPQLLKTTGVPDNKTRR